MNEPAVELGTDLVRVPVVFYLKQPDYQHAREALLKALASIPVDFALSCGLRHMIVAVEEEYGPPDVNFGPN